MKRTTILIDDDTYLRYRSEARRRQTSVSVLMREALEKALPADENPNQWLLDLADQLKGIEWKEGPPIDSDEFKEEYARWLERDSFNPEPAK